MPLGDRGLVSGELQLTILDQRVLKLRARDHPVHCCKLPVQFFGALCEVLIQIRVGATGGPPLFLMSLPLAGKQVVVEVCVAATAGNPPVSLAEVVIELVHGFIS